MSSRNEDILKSMIDGTGYNKAPESRIEKLLLDLKNSLGSGGSGSGSGVTYTNLYLYENDKYPSNVNNLKIRVGQEEHPILDLTKKYYLFIVTKRDTYRIGELLLLDYDSLNSIRFALPSIASNSTTIARDTDSLQIELRLIPDKSGRVDYAMVRRGGSEFNHLSNRVDIAENDIEYLKEKNQGTLLLNYLDSFVYVSENPGDPNDPTYLNYILSQMTDLPFRLFVVDDESYVSAFFNIHSNNGNDVKLLCEIKGLMNYACITHMNLIVEIYIIDGESVMILKTVNEVDLTHRYINDGSEVVDAMGLKPTYVVNPSIANAMLRMLSNS